MSSKRAIRGGAVSKGGGWHLFGEREEKEERGGRAEMGGETARELGKLSGKSANIVCVSNVKDIQHRRRIEAEI